MKIYTKKDLDEYLKNDYILEKLKSYKEFDDFTSQQWLLDMPAKRMIYHDIYGDLLAKKNKKILDVGGGFCGLSKILMENHKYTLVDTMVHDDHDKIRATESQGDPFWANIDWYEFEPTGEYDYIIANDLFPNVDQRLNLFIKKFKPFAKKMIMTLTYYDNDRFYKVKRLDADEVLTIQPWNSAITSMMLGERLPDASGELPLFNNGRYVYKKIL